MIKPAIVISKIADEVFARCSFSIIDDDLVSLSDAQNGHCPLKTRAIAEARIKYDKLDASILADLAGADLIPKCYVPDKYIREIRTLIRHRIDLARRRAQLKNKVHTTLDKYMLKYDGDLFTHKGFQWLDSQNLSVIDRQVIINSYLKEISTINELMTNVEMQMASLAMSDKRVDLLLGFTGIDYYGALLHTTY